MRKIMNRPMRQAIITVFFLAVLAFVGYQGAGGQLADWWRQLTGKSEAPPQAFDVGESLRRYGFALQESAKECGIDFRHEPPTLDPKLSHIMSLVAAMNASVSIVDFDRDGLLDIYV